VEDRLDDLGKKPGRKRRDQIGIPHQFQKPFHIEHILFLFFSILAQIRPFAQRKMLWLFLPIQDLYIRASPQFPQRIVDDIMELRSPARMDGANFSAKEF
jgi:hypothetical protein